jgi:hypothetical protein
MLAFADTTQIKALKINGNVVDFEPPVVNTVMINALASEITINSDNSGSFPADYVQKSSNIVIKPTDSSLKCADFEYIAVLMTLENSQYTTVIPIDECIAAGMASYNETDDTLVVNDMTSLMGADKMGAVFTHLNTETGECTPVDTTCTFTTITGGLESPYMFETEGIHEVEIEFVDNADIGGTFTRTCIAEISYMKDIILINAITFNGCNSLTSVTLGNEVTSIGKSAFYDCDSLTSITIPDSVTSIGEDAFRGCSGLTSITIPDSVTTIGEDAFQSCTSLASIIIPDSVTSIGNWAFYNCTSLASIIIPDSVTSIGNWAFYECDSLTEITIPDSVTEIGEYAFHNCSNLASVDLGNGVTEIGSRAFYQCSNLTSITIPDGITEIGEYTFANCSNLASVYCKATTPPVGNSDMFLTNASGRKIYVPMASVGTYKSAEYWSNYADAIEGYNF